MSDADFDRSVKLRDPSDIYPDESSLSEMDSSLSLLCSRRSNSRYIIICCSFFCSSGSCGSSGEFARVLLFEAFELNICTFVLILSAAEELVVAIWACLSPPSFGLEN